MENNLNLVFLKCYQELENLSNSDSKRYNAIKNSNEELIDLFRKTRNILVHNVVDGKAPFEVSKNLVDSLKDILKKIKLKAISLATPFNKIWYVTKKTKIVDVIRIMNKYNYSFLPVLDENGLLTHIISEKSVLFMLNDMKSLQNDNLLVEDKLMDFELTDNPNEYYGFISKQTYAYDAKNIFSSVVDGKRCGVLFITDNGLKNEKVRGMITAWDLLKI